MPITVETKVAAPLAEVWRAYTTPADIKQWNAASDDWHTTAATVDLREGGQFSSRMEAKDGSMGFDFAGVYTKIEPQRLIEYSFGDRKARVDFEAGPRRRRGARRLRRRGHEFGRAAARRLAGDPRQFRPPRRAAIGLTPPPSSTTSRASAARAAAPASPAC